MSPLQRQLEQLDISDRLATVLGEIMDDPMITKMILIRDAGLWAAAVEALSAYEGRPTQGEAPG